MQNLKMYVLALLFSRIEHWPTITLQELRQQHHVITELRTEIKSLQADNLKLYEKVRYMQSYREDNISTSSTVYPAGKQDDLAKYHARYEEAMNPFEAFRGRVRHASLSFGPFLSLILVTSFIFFRSCENETFTGSCQSVPGT